MYMRKRTSIIWTISDVEFQELLNNKSSMVDILRHLGLNPYSGNHRTAQERIKTGNFDLTLFNINKKNFRNKLMTSLHNKAKNNNEDIFCENSQYDRSTVKRRVIECFLMEYKCADCENCGEYNGKKLALQLDHINGINNDNRLENLRWLCPNCHSQTETFAGKRHKKINKCESCNNEISNQAKLCRKCHNSSKMNFTINGKKRKYKIEFPPPDEVQKLVWEKPMRDIAKDFGVSDVSIKNYCKRNNLTIPSRGFWLKGVIPNTRK